MGGRKKRADIWNHYRQGSDKSAICKHCDHKYKVANVNKMGRHLLTCDRCPDTVKNDLKTPLRNITNDGNTSVITLPPSPHAPVPSLLNQSQASTSSCPSSEEICFKNLTTKFAKAVFVTGSPLSLVEHPLWIDFFKDLQPNFQLPSRKSLATSHLDKVYAEIKKEVTDCLKITSYLHLQCDGWTNVNNEGIMNFIISNPEPYFVESLDTEDNRHTSKYLSDEILKVMNTYGNSKFVVLIGDNAKNLQKAFEMVKLKCPHIVPLNCAAHTLNLLVYDILKCNVIKQVMDLATDVIKTVKKSQVLTSLLNKIIKDKKIGETLKLPIKTRWGSHVAALKSLQNSKLCLMTLAVHEDAVNLAQEIKSTILDDSFWSFIEVCLSVLEPVTEPIFKLESNNSNIHTVFTTFKDINSKLEFLLPTLNILNDEDKLMTLNAVKKRTKECIKPIHLAAYLLDPNTQGLALNEEEDILAMNFIEEMSCKLNITTIVDIANYRARQGFWNNRLLWENVADISPVTWWKGLCSKKCLSKVAIRILSAPCTSAATERSFSKHGHIHSKKRNRLTPERAAKLTFVSYNWDLLHKHDCVSECENTELSEEGSSNEFQNSQDPIDNTDISEIEFLNCDSVTSSDEE